MARFGKGTHSVQTLPLSHVPFCPFVQFLFICNQLFSRDQKHRNEKQFRLKTASICQFLADGKSGIQQEENSFYLQIGLKFEEETSKMLHLEHGFLWC